jgi:hypothetical protein
MAMEWNTEDTEMGAKPRTEDDIKNGTYGGTRADKNGKEGEVEWMLQN